MTGIIQRESTDTQGEDDPGMPEWRQGYGITEPMDARVTEPFNGLRGNEGKGLLEPLGQETLVSDSIPPVPEDNAFLFR